VHGWRKVKGRWVLREVDLRVLVVTEHGHVNYGATERLVERINELEQK
jgi:hypothetical protein